MFGLQGKVAIVTGGGNGLGKEFAFALAREGAPVVVADIDEAAAKGVATTIADAGGQAISVGVDVTIEQQHSACRRGP